MFGILRLTFFHHCSPALSRSEESERRDRISRTHSSGSWRKWRLWRFCCWRSPPGSSVSLPLPPLSPAPPHSFSSQPPLEGSPSFPTYHYWRLPLYIQPKKLLWSYTYASNSPPRLGVSPQQGFAAQVTPPHSPGNRISSFWHFESLWLRLHLLIFSSRYWLSSVSSSSSSTSRPTRWSLWYWYLDVCVDHLYFQIQVTEKSSTAMCYINIIIVWSFHCIWLLELHNVNFFTQIISVQLNLPQEKARKLREVSDI